MLGGEGARISVPTGSSGWGADTGVRSRFVPSPGQSPWELSPRQAEAAPGRASRGVRERAWARVRRGWRGCGGCHLGQLGPVCGPRGQRGSEEAGAAMEYSGASDLGAGPLCCPPLGLRAHGLRCCVWWPWRCGTRGRARLSCTVPLAGTQRGRSLGPTPGPPSRRARARPSLGLAAVSWPFPSPLARVHSLCHLKESRSQGHS